MDWNPWLVQAELPSIAVFPIPAREVKRTVPLGNILAELFSNPSFVIFLWLELTTIWSPISAGEYQLIFPFQYSSIFVLGVPPPIISEMSPSLRCSQVKLFFLIIMIIWRTMVN